MADKPKIDGYIWRYELKKAQQANRAAREVMRQLLRNSEAGAGARAILYAQLAQDLSDTLAALMNLQQIGDNSNGTEKE